MARRIGSVRMTPLAAVRWCARCDVGTDAPACWSCGALLTVNTARPTFTPDPYRPPRPEET